MRLCALIAGIAGIAGCACVPAGPPQRVERIRAAGAAFSVRYFPEDSEAARQIERSLERAVHTAERWGELSAPVLITIHPTHRDLEAAARRDDAWLRAWARYASVDLQSPRTWSSGAASDAQMTELLSHELAHCVMFQAVKRDGRPGRAIPLWFREGMASAAAGQEYGWVSPEAIRRLYLEDPPGGGSEPLREDALAASGSPRGSEPDLVYAAAARTFRSLLDRFGDEPVRRVMAGMSAGDGFSEAFRQATGISVQQFEGDFEERVLGLRHPTTGVSMAELGVSGAEPPMSKMAKPAACFAPEALPLAKPAARFAPPAQPPVTVSWARPRPLPPPLLREAGSTR